MNESVGDTNKPRVTVEGAVTRQTADALRVAQSFSVDTAAFAKAFAPSLEVTRQAADALRAAQSFSSAHTPTAPELDNPQTSAPPTRLEELGELRKSLACAEAAQRATASQIDELLTREVTSGVAGTCWGCGNATLVAGRVACTFCGGPISEMFLEAWSLTEPPESR